MTTDDDDEAIKKVVSDGLVSNESLRDYDDESIQRCSVCEDFLGSSHLTVVMCIWSDPWQRTWRRSDM